MQIDLAAYELEILHQEGAYALYRGRARANCSSYPPSVLVSTPTSEHPDPERTQILSNELALQTELDSAWAARPLALVQHQGRAALVLEDPLGEPLNLLLDTLKSTSASGTAPAAGPAMDLELFLRLAIGLAVGLGEVHRRGIIHKNVKPSHVLVDIATRRVWLTGFGIASRLPRERQAPQPPETIAGTLAYMAPEQTGRMNRSIDPRSDLYSLGVTLYQMLTGSVPFTAADPMEWVHCHVARKPPTPSERVENLPVVVSAIIMKLLAKTAEHRYQTAAGLGHDLRSCLEQWETQKHIEELPLGEHDTPDRLLIQEKLYGRASEIESLLAAFDRIVDGGVPELALLSGYSGIGKSSVVNELHRVLVPQRGLFAIGKFDRFKRNIPYATLAEAFQGLVRLLLAKSETELTGWRQALGEALGPNGQLVVDLVPQLKLIIGEQPPVPALSPLEAQRRLQLVFGRFLAVFARAEHPLALFLDDLQWLDAATLDLLKDLLIQTDVRHLLLIGAYRDNEVTATDPLMRTLEDIRNAGVPVREIVLGPLDGKDVCRLVADSLYCDFDHAWPLAQLVQEKTDANPFFIIQFLTTLVEEGLVTLDHGAGRWLWDLGRIQTKGYTDNVVDLMVGKLKRLPDGTQRALLQLACLGSSAEFALLAMVLETSKERLDQDLKEGLQAGLVLSSEGSYRFLHDRVQEASYSLIPEAQRGGIHLRIGRLMVTHTPPEKRAEAIFETVGQLNRGAALITLLDEQERLADLNLIAGKRAKSSTAYVAALAYFVAGAQLLSAQGWEHRPELMFALESSRAECEFLTGALVAAETRLTMLSSRASTTIDQATVACLQIDLYMLLHRGDRAVDVCLAYLRRLGTDWSAHPTMQDARREYDRTRLLLGSRELHQLVELPINREPEIVATLDVLGKGATPAMFTDANLLSLVVCRMVNLSLEHGNSAASPTAYVWLGSVAGARFGDYQPSFGFGKLGCDLVERPGLEQFQARTYMSFGILVIPWTKHLRTGPPLLYRARDVLSAIGDLTRAAFCCSHLITNLLAMGEPLADVQREAERSLEFVRKTRFGLVIEIIAAQLALIRTLRGSTAVFGCLTEPQFDERQVERRLSSEPPWAWAACWYWIRKLQARFMAGDHRSAVEALLNAERLLWTSRAFIESAEAHFYGALSHAAICDVASAIEYEGHVRALIEHHRQLLEWASSCPENFQDRAALVGAEIARLEGRELDAERLYEEAIGSAHDNEFIHNEALANELAARFYAARGFETIAQAYRRAARHGYLRWGAEGKVRQLDGLHPHLRPEEIGTTPSGTIGAPLEQLDLATVIKASQAIASEMDLARLIDTLMRSAIEHAGAERAVLMLPRGGEPRIAAEGTTNVDAIAVRLLDDPVTPATLPEAVFQYVLHAQESVILDDAELTPFSSDPYIRERHARSLLCLPLSNQSKLVGVLYLENNLAPRVFVPARIAVLKLLASQAAISLENSRLYRELAEREARIRRLVDADIIGVFIFELAGPILEANDSFLTMLGYHRADLLAGRLEWRRLTPPEWLERDERLYFPELQQNGSLQPYEKEYLRKDGSRVSVLIGVATFEEAGTQGVAYVLDLTELKRAQEALNRAGTELAHVSRVAALSALAASIAHEVNQPLSGIITNAGTGLRMLDSVSPNIVGARETLRRLLRDGKRAADVVQRLRALFTKRDSTLERVDLNEATQEVIALSANDLHRNQIIVQSELADDLPTIIGDRIQLQQVILNLLSNARDAMLDVHDRARQVHLKTELDADDCLRLTVRDVGVGLPTDSPSSLFDPFHTTKTTGMGVGLFISRSIIERHQGRLWAQPNDGPGATFAFCIPRDPHD